MLVTKHNQPLVTSPRHGITLIEVMMSTMVVSLGILGLASLIPLGTHLTNRGTLADRVAILGERAFHEAKIREYFNPTRWTNPTSYSINATTGGNSPLPLRQPYLIDPMFFGTNGTDNSRRLFPYNLQYSTGQPVQMFRLSLNTRSGNTSSISLPQAKLAFQSEDDLKSERPSDGELPAFQTFFNRPAAVSGTNVNGDIKRAAAGDYSWMIMLTPEPFDLSNVSALQRTPPILSPQETNWLAPPINMAAPKPAFPSGSTLPSYLDSKDDELIPTLLSAVTDVYTASVIIMKKRQGAIPGDLNTSPSGDISVIDTDEEKTNERTLDVTSFIGSGGYSTGELEIQQTGGSLEDAEERVLKVSNGDWICLTRRLPMAGAPYSYPRGDVYQWYRVVMVDDIVDTSGSGVGPFKRRLTISGPDWPTDAHVPTHAIIVEGVVGVYTKRVRLESQSPWSP